MAFSKGKMATSDVDNAYGGGKGVFEDGRGGDVRMARMGSVDELMGKTGAGKPLSTKMGIAGPVDRKITTLGERMGYTQQPGFKNKAQGGQDPLAQGGTLEDIMGFRGHSSGGGKLGR